MGNSWQRSNQINSLMMPYIFFYMNRCRSLHFWPAAELLRDDGTSGLGPLRQSKWAVSRPPAFGAFWVGDVSGPDKVGDPENFPRTPQHSP